MDKSGYDNEVRNMLDTIGRIRFDQPKEVIIISKEILKYANRVSDDNLIGYAEFYIGDAYYTLCNGDNCLMHIKKAIAKFNKVNNHKMLGECYNLLGILFTYQGNIVNSLECFQEAMKIVEKYEIHYLGAMVYANYSEMCNRTNNFDSALKYGELSKAHCDFIKNTPRYKNICKAVLIVLSRVSIKIGRKDEASRYIEELRYEFNDVENEELGLDYALLETVWANFIQDKQLEEKCVKKTIKAFFKCKYKIDFFWSCVEFMAFLWEEERLDTLEIVVKEMEKYIHDFFPYLQTRILSFKIDLLKKQNRTEELVDALQDYYLKREQQNQFDLKIMKMIVELKNSLMISKHTNMLLQESVGKDELTQIANRRKLSEEADNAFENICIRGNRFAVEMIDIDNFKEINDTYGHAMGDSCLVLLADVLKSVENDNLFCARYGGDEFMLIYKGYTDDKIIETALVIKNKLKTLLEENDFPKFTISQGICNNIPEEDNKLWDFTSVADEAMYYSKKTGGNRITLVRSKKEMTEMIECEITRLKKCSQKNKEKQINKRDK